MNDYSELHKRMHWPAVLHELDQLRRSRAAIIEECARVADEMALDYGERNYSRLAAAIRALKDKP